MYELVASGPHLRPLTRKRLTAPKPNARDGQLRRLATALPNAAARRGSSIKLSDAKIRWVHAKLVPKLELTISLLGRLVHRMKPPSFLAELPIREGHGDRDDRDVVAWGASLEAERVGENAFGECCGIADVIEDRRS